MSSLFFDDVTETSTFLPGTLFLTLFGDLPPLLKVTVGHPFTSKVRRFMFPDLRRLLGLFVLYIRRSLEVLYLCRTSEEVNWVTLGKPEDWKSRHSIIKTQQNSVIM